MIIVIERTDATDDAPAATPEGATPLGQVAGLDWYRLPDNSDMPATARQPTDDELAHAKRELPAIKTLKASVRRRIEREVGDVHEILADQARQIEALTALAVRLGQVVFGGETLGADLQQRYLDRINPVATALDSGALLLRGDLEDAAEMLARVQSRTDAVNRLIGEHYLPRRDEVLS